MFQAQVGSRIRAVALSLGIVAMCAPAILGVAQAQEASLKVADTEMFGPILTDKDGMTLYTWVKDEPGVTNCYDACATSWPPATVEGEVMTPPDLPGMVGTTIRNDGAMQLTYNDWPLYRWQRDTAPGQITGDGSLSAGGLWPVATTGAVMPAVMLTKHERLGYILANGSGMTLYTWEGDQPEESTCYDNCANAWPPVLVDGKLTVGAGLSRVLGTATRRDGSIQATFKKMPLYTFRRDTQPGDTNGEGLTGFGAPWSIAVMQVFP